MIPELYQEDTGDGALNGYPGKKLASLRDTISCTIHETLDRQFYLEMEYPVSGWRSADIEVGTYIAVYVPYFQEQQFFNVVKTTTSNGRIKIEANHSGYRIHNMVVGFTNTTIPGTVQNFLDTISKNCEGLYNSPVNFKIINGTSSAEKASYNFQISTPRTIEDALLGESESLYSVLDLAGCTPTVYYDGLYIVVSFSGRGETVPYAIDINKPDPRVKSATVDLSSENFYDYLYPYWTDSETGTSYTTDDGIVRIGSGFLYNCFSNYPKVEVMDLSSLIKEMPSDPHERSELIKQTALEEWYFQNKDKTNRETNYSMNISIDFADYRGSSDNAPIWNYQPGDMINLRFWNGNYYVDGNLYDNGYATYNTQVTEIEYDALHERYTKIETGQMNANFYERIAYISKKTNY